MSFLRKHKEQEYERPLFSIGKVTRGTILEVNFLRVAGNALRGPFLDVQIVHPNGEWRSDIFRARVDTGADISSVPRGALGEEWALPLSRPAKTIDFSGKVSTVRSYFAHFAILDREENVFWEKLLSRGILLTNSPTGLLGMDVLKYFRWSGGNEVFKIETL